MDDEATTAKRRRWDTAGRRVPAIRQGLGRALLPEAGRPTGPSRALPHITGGRVPTVQRLASPTCRSASDGRAVPPRIRSVQQPSVIGWSHGPPAGPPTIKIASSGEGDGALPASDPTFDRPRRATSPRAFRTAAPKRHRPGGPTRDAPSLHTPSRRTTPPHRTTLIPRSCPHA